MEENNRKDLIPRPSTELKSIPADAWALEDEEDTQTLENLLNEVDTQMRGGLPLTEVLRRKLLPPEMTSSTSLLMTDDNYASDQLEFYRTKTSKGYRPAIGIRNVRADIWDAVYFITRNHEEFSGKAHRIVSIVETCMIHMGLRNMNLILEGRPKIVKERLEAIRKGSKERRRRGKPQQYEFVNFTDTLETQQNVWCQSSQDYARAATIAEDFGWSMGFVVQMAMIMAIATSEKLPTEMKNNAIEEVKFFTEFLDKAYL